MRFTWLSNSPWSPSGYGQQTRINVHRIATKETGHMAGIICYFGLEGGTLQVTENIICLPKRHHPYGADVFVPHSDAFRADVEFSLTDTWCVEPENFPPEMKWIPWYPVDHEPMPPAVRQKLNMAWKRIAMSKFGVEQTHLMGMDCMYVPHSVETEVMKPMDKAESRKYLGIPEDKFVCGIVAMNKGNPSRKNFVEQIGAFANCSRRRGDMFLYLQTETGGAGVDAVDLKTFLPSVGLLEGKDYMFCNQYTNFIGFPADHMAKLYSSFDVLLAAGAGEGFGIPIVEAQACGCPVIAGDWTAMTELVNGGHLIDKKDAFAQYSNFGAFLYRPNVAAVEHAIDCEYKKHTPMTKTIQWIKDNYDADLVFEKHWKPTLAEIEAAL